MKPKITEAEKDKEACAVCHKTGSDSDDNSWITCDKCCQWLHGVCVALNKQDVKHITRLAVKGTRWFCPPCIESMAKSDATERVNVPGSSDERIGNIEKSVDQLRQLIANQGTMFENQLSHLVSSQSSYADMVKKTNDDMMKMAKVNESRMGENMKVASDLLVNQERDKRKCNAILYGVNEDQENATNTTTLEEVKKIFEELSLPTHTLKKESVFRLGKLRTSGGRPIKVCLESETAKWDLVKRVNAATPGEGVFCKLDLPQVEREQEYALRVQVRKLREENPDDTYKIKNRRIYKEKTGGAMEEIATPGMVSPKQKSTVC